MTHKHLKDQLKIYKLVISLLIYLFYFFVTDSLLIYCKVIFQYCIVVLLTQSECIGSTVIVPHCNIIIHKYLN